APDRAILYLHGGAFLCCGLNSHRRLVARISKASGAGVLHVGYRMMPRNTINHAVADALDGYRWLLAHGYRGEDVVVAGDSAGGYLAFMTALEAMDADLPRPAGVVALSPLADMDPAGKRAHANANRCPVFTLRAVEALTDLADRVETRFEVDGVSPERRSPVDADLVGHPRTLIQVGSQEMLLADAELMASRLVAAGVECELQVWERQVHVFQAASWLPEARAAVAEVGEFVKQATAAAMPAVHAHTG
ncbi:alpha/beta hydrolase, partial [Solicola sp. PLA-1-18]|uniref:alpha/beta hydrolase n=1 Tax=Solicola sp. PLA-1-18 TaxID=3380532 RepID=UPI003B7A83F8